MAETYENTLGVEHETAVEMAKLTKGYAFAFQVLGYFTYKEENRDYRKVIAKYRLYLDEFVYEKLWSLRCQYFHSFTIMAFSSAPTFVPA